MICLKPGTLDLLGWEPGFSTQLTLFPYYIFHLPLSFGVRLTVLAFKILPNLFLAIHRRPCLPSGELLRLTDVSIFTSRVVQVDLEALTVFVQGCLVTPPSWALLHIFTRSHWAAFCLEIYIHLYKNTSVFAHYICT